MGTLNEMIRSSTLLRLLSSIFLFLALTAALIVGSIELLSRQSLNQYVILIVGAGLGHALSLLNINYGVSLSPSKQPATPSTGKLTPPTI
jgi:hypothetical protein